MSGKPTLSKQDRLWESGGGAGVGFTATRADKHNVINYGELGQFDTDDLPSIETATSVPPCRTIYYLIASFSLVLKYWIGWRVNKWGEIELQLQLHWSGVECLLDDIFGICILSLTRALISPLTTEVESSNLLSVLTDSPLLERMCMCIWRSFCGGEEVVEFYLWNQLVYFGAINSGNKGQFIISLRGRWRSDKGGLKSTELKWAFFVCLWDSDALTSKLLSDYKNALECFELTNLCHTKINSPGQWINCEQLIRVDALNIVPLHLFISQHSSCQFISSVEQQLGANSRCVHVSPNCLFACQTRVLAMRCDETTWFLCLSICISSVE